MELTREHFDKQFEELNSRLDHMATKAELAEMRSELVAKSDAQITKLEAYVDSVAGTIIEAVDNGFSRIEKRSVTRDEKQKAIDKDIKQLKSALNLS